MRAMANDTAKLSESSFSLEERLRQLQAALDAALRDVEQQQRSLIKLRANVRELLDATLERSFT
jgi:hypothetical protein